ncbi:MAG: hypothetical protein ACOYD4_17290, partial [Solirubrobacterales bacterium]
MGSKDRPLKRELETTTAERLAAIVEAAERAATRVIDDAEEEARRYLAEARREADAILADRLSALGEETDSLIAQAEEIRQRSERLLEALTGARARLAMEADAGDGARPGPRAHHRAVVPVEEPAPPAPAPAEPQPPGPRPLR